MTCMPHDCYNSLHSPASQMLQAHILEICWGKRLDPTEYDKSLKEFRPYFHHYQTVCQQSSTDNVGRLTHGHILQAFKLMETETYDNCRDELIMLLKDSDDRRLKVKDPQRLTDFASCWIIQTGQALLLLDLTEWQGPETLKRYLERDHFIPSIQDDSYRMPVSLNLRNLQDIGGLKIRWTGLLSEHLSLEQEDSQLAVFHQRCILDLLQNNDLYPKSLGQELRLTFGMLLPRDDSKSRAWFNKQIINPKNRAPGSSLVLDSRFESCRGLRPGERNIRKLDYFRDRMICVKDLYDCHEPQTFMQHLRDYRRPAQRWGFLIAILVFLFGTGQLIEGAIQCYRSYYPA